MRGGSTWLAAFVLVVIAGCGTSTPERIAPATPTPDLTPVTVRVGHVASPQWAPLYVAIDRGYFKKLNVDVQLTALRLGQDPIDLLARGQLDAVVTDFNASMFNALAGGRKLTVAGSMPAIPSDGSKPLALEVAKPLVDAGKVRTVADLKGRKIAIDGGAGSGNGYLADLVLQQAGISLHDLTVIDLASASMETAMSVHGIDVALAPGPFTTRMEQRGLTTPLASPPPGTTWSGVLYGTKLTGSPGLRFFQALVQAARDLRGPSRTADDTLAIVSKYTGVTADVLRTVPPYGWDAALKPDTASLAGLQATYREEGLLKYATDLAPARFVDATYSKRAASAVR